MQCFPTFTAQQLFSPPPFPPLPLTYFPGPPPLPPLPLKKVLASSPPSETFYPAYTPSSSTYEGSLMVFTRLPVFWCTWFTCIRLRALWDRTGIALSSFFFFGGDVLGEARLEHLTHWGGIVSSAWCRDNDLARPRMGKITIYHVQNFSGPSSKQNYEILLELTLAPPSRVRGACKSQIQYVINITH